MRSSCLIFVIEDTPQPGHFDIGLQFPDLTIGLTAKDLSFARRILDFVAETRGNPQYRDIPIGNGVYRYMPEKSVDLSASFQGASVKLHKIGEYDNGYVVHFSISSDFFISLELHDEQLDAFLDSVRDIADDQPSPEATP